MEVCADDVEVVSHQRGVTDRVSHPNDLGFAHLVSVGGVGDSAGVLPRVSGQRDCPETRE